MKHLSAEIISVNDLGILILGLNSQISTDFQPELFNSSFLDIKILSDEDDSPNLNLTWGMEGFSKDKTEIWLRLNISNSLYVSKGSRMDTIVLNFTNQKIAKSLINSAKLNQSLHSDYMVIKSKIPR